MRLVPYPNCCGAYFMVDVTMADVEKVYSKEKFPTTKGTWETYPNANAAPVCYQYTFRPSIAYFICILDEKDHLTIGPVLVEKHGFKLLSSTKERYMYVRAREKR